MLYPGTLSSVRRHRHNGRQHNECTPDIVCLSHLRWDFVYQRPQHLMSRFGSEQRVFYVEEPIWDCELPSLSVHTVGENLHIVKPMLPSHLSPEAVVKAQGALLDDLFREYAIFDYVLWYYTPAALSFSSHLKPRAVVYDCMDELSLFLGASLELLHWEEALFGLADVVFTGGPSLYRAKHRRHHNVHLFPSSIDFDHFSKARYADEPADQAVIPRPRLGFFGVIDERLDTFLVDAIARARPDWQLVFVGPVVKIDPSRLPQRDNIHYLGARDYETLPTYLAGWDVALMPFALNEATRFISPTKTPEYLAGGTPVVSTPIRDVVRLYGNLKMVRIAADEDEFVQNLEELLDQGVEPDWLSASDRHLAQTSWESTWLEMRQQLDAILDVKKEQV